MAAAHHGPAVRLQVHSEGRPASPRPWPVPRAWHTAGDCEWRAQQAVAACGISFRRRVEMSSCSETWGVWSRGVTEGPSGSPPSFPALSCRRGNLSRSDLNSEPAGRGPAVGLGRRDGAPERVIWRPDSWSHDGWPGTLERSHQRKQWRRPQRLQAARARSAACCLHLSSVLCLTPVCPAASAVLAPPGPALPFQAGGH